MENSNKLYKSPDNDSTSGGNPKDDIEKVPENAKIENNDLFNEELYYELKLILPIKWEKIIKEGEIYKDTDPNATSRYASISDRCIGLRPVPQGVQKEPQTGSEDFFYFAGMNTRINLPQKFMKELENFSEIEEAKKNLPQTCEANVDFVFPLKIDTDYYRTKIRVNYGSSYANEKIGYKTLFGKPLELIKGIPEDFFKYKRNAWDEFSFKKYSDSLPKEVLESFDEDWKEWMNDVKEALEFPSDEEIDEFEYKLATSKK